MRTSIFTLLLSCLALSPQLFATTIYVNKNAMGANNGTTWANAFNDLQDAINSANAGDTIWVAAGIYTPKKDLSGNSSPTDPRTKTFSIQKNNIKIYGGFVGTETSLNQRNPILNVTDISGDIGIINNSSDNSYNVIRIVSNATNGAITPATVIDGFRILHGMATSRSGAGIYMQTGIGLETSPTISNNIITGNTATNRGAGIHMETTNGGSCNPVITHNTFDWNNCNFGAGISSYCSNNGSCAPVITTNTFMSCQASIAGGAIYSESGTSGSSTISIFNNFFSLNSANSGGAVYINNKNSSTINIINNTFHSNNAFAANGGGALGISNSGSNPATCSVKNSIFWNNGVNYYQGNVVNTTIDYSIYDDGIINGTVVLPATVTGSNNLDANPLVDPYNFDLAPCSPAIDAGNNAAWLTTGLTNDIRQTSRPFNTTIDIGAVEYPTSYTPPTVTGTAIPCSPQGLIIVVSTTSTYPMEYSIDSGLTWQTSDTFFFLNPGNYNVVGRVAGVTGCPVFDANNPVVMPFPCCYNGVIYVDVNATGNNNGSSWANAFTDLQNALDYYCGNNEIWVAAGTYKSIRYSTIATPDNRYNTYTINKDMPLYGGFNGTETSKNQRNITLNQTIISGDVGILNDDTDNLIQLLFIDATNGVISNNTIIDGFYFKDAYDDISGLNAPIYINGRQSACSPIFRNNHILDNHTTSFGIVFVEALDGLAMPIFQNNTFNNNTANLGGSGIYCGVSGTGLINLMVDSCTFTNNGNANSNEGGGIFRYAYPSGEFYMTVTNSVFDNNTRGAISAKGQSITITNNTFSNNYGSYQGCLSIDSDSAWVMNNIFTNNQSDYRGGGLAILGAAHVYNNVFEGNTAMDGGGAISIAASTSSVTPMSPLYANNLFYNNSSSNNGGAIFVDANPNTSKNQLFINNTFYGNTATNSGGAFYNKASGMQNQIANSIFWNNGDEISSTTALQLNYSILDDNLINNNVTLPTNVIGSNNLDSDPLFNNSSTGDFELQNNSPAIDAGNTALWNTTGLSTDLLGNTRPHAGIATDLGAYESSVILSLDWVATINPKVYPNPTLNNITIDLEKEYTDLNIQVYTVSGALIQEEFVGSQNTINLSLNGTAGVYIIKINSNNQALGQISVLKK